MDVPSGGGLPTADGRVQMYPCYAFDTHIVYAEIDRVTGQVSDWIRTGLPLAEVVGESSGLGDDAKVGEFLLQAL